MFFKIIFGVFALTQLSYSISFYPLPKSFTNSIYLSPYIGIARFKSLNLDKIGGQTKTNHEVVGVGLKWGRRLQGLGVNYQWLQSAVISPAGNHIKKSRINLNEAKLRWFVNVLDDGAGQMSLFGSWGTFFGHASVLQQSESEGIHSIKERNVSGFLVDVGAIFGYQLNPEWQCFIEALYQVSYNEKTSTLIGIDTQPMVDVTGAKIILGSAINL